MIEYLRKQNGPGGEAYKRKEKKGKETLFLLSGVGEGITCPCREKKRYSKRFVMEGH